MADIYIRRWFGKRGPYTEEEIRSRMREGRLRPATPAWRQGMQHWEPLSAWGIFSTTAEVRRRVSRISRRNDGYVGPPPAEPGIGRLAYFVLSVFSNAAILLAIVGCAIAAAHMGEALFDLSRSDPGDKLAWKYVPAIHTALAAGCAAWLGLRRIESIGCSWMWVLLLFVPFVNGLKGLALVLLPPGYATSRKLDLAAWFWILVIGAAIWYVANLTIPREEWVRLWELIRDRYRALVRL